MAAIASSSVFAVTPTSASNILPTPFWFSSSQPSCGATVYDASNNAYCCDGLLIDTTQPILTSDASGQSPFYFYNMRCCSGDPDIALASVTTCSTGTEATLATSDAAVVMASTSSSGSSNSSSSSSSSSNGGAAAISTKTETQSTGITTTVTAATPTKTNDGDILDAGSLMRYACTVVALLAILLA